MFYLIHEERGAFLAVKSFHCGLCIGEVVKTLSSPDWYWYSWEKSDVVWHIENGHMTVCGGVPLHAIDTMKLTCPHGAA